MKTENVGGHTFDTNYDNRYKCIDLELVKVYISNGNKDGYYEIHINATTKDKKFKNILKLHIKGAIKLKSIIDNLVYDANQDQFDNIAKTQIMFNKNQTEEKWEK